MKSGKHISRADDAMRTYAALDLHKKYSEAVVMGEDGVVLRKGRMQNDPKVIERFSNSLDNATVVIESSST